ncbi:hypothetical protein ACFC5Z_13180 [Streptomyces sp. NPDC056004]|uniref:hypothetical protein n=1 Tax=Streptomyces sp. NPDC056004 TaxID=3345677 RepID=UPI0035E048FE
MLITRYPHGPQAQIRFLLDHYDNRPDLLASLLGMRHWVVRRLARGWAILLVRRCADCSTGPVRRCRRAADFGEGMDARTAWVMARLARHPDERGYAMGHLDDDRRAVD